MHTINRALAIFLFVLANFTCVAQIYAREDGATNEERIKAAQSRVAAAEDELLAAKAELKLLLKNEKNRSVRSSKETNACIGEGGSCMWNKNCCPGLFCAGGINAACIPN